MNDVIPIGQSHPSVTAAAVAAAAAGGAVIAGSVVPVPRCPVRVRVATPADQPFIDQLQKAHTHMVGWMPGKQIEGKIAAGQVLVAEEVTGHSSLVTGQRQGPTGRPFPPSLTSDKGRVTNDTRVGYCIAHDQYAGRDDVGIIYQLNVLPLRQRNLIGATLIKATFERAAYGCRLFGLWCAQDIQANWFWEAIGFVPLAFRTGSASKQRIHIYWQRRIRDDDTGERAGGATPYWFPSQTKGGSIREQRLVFPIPPGTHWRDAKPIVLPGMTVEPELPKALPGGAPLRPRPQQPKYSAAQKAAIQRSQSAHLAGVPLGKKAVITASGIKYVARTDYVPETDAPDGLIPPVKPKRPPAPRRKNDPQLVAAARELRDRWVEEVNAGRLLVAAGQGKYDVSRALAAEAAEKPVALLAAG